MLRRGILAGVLLVMCACVAAPSPSTSPTTLPTAPVLTTTTIVTTTSAPPPTVATTIRPSQTQLPPIPPCLTPQPRFGESEQIGQYSPTSSDSALLAAIDWRDWEVCERFRFSLASTEGAPTLVPPSVTLSSLPEQGVLRLQMGPEIETSAVAHQLIESRLVEQLFVVRSADGGLTVDLHLAEPVAARLIPSSAPATLTVDLRPGGVAFSRKPVIVPRAVVFLPGDEGNQYPLSVSGYLQPGITESVATLTNAQGETTESHFPLAGGDDVWSSFAAVFPEGSPGWVTLELEGFQATLFFGE